MAKITRRNAIITGFFTAGAIGMGSVIHTLDKELDFEPEATLDKKNPDHDKVAQIFATTYSPEASDSVGFFGFFKTSHEINRSDMNVLASIYNPSGTAATTTGQINPHVFDVRVMYKGDEAGIALRENGTVVGTIKGWKSPLTADDIIDGTEAISPSASRPAVAKANSLSGGPR
jgi:hypothetical protein